MEEGRLVAEGKEVDLLLESTLTEVNRLKTRADQAKAKVEEARQNPGSFQREEIFGATDEHTAAVGRRLTMEGQLASLQAKRKLLDRVLSLVASARAEPPRPSASATGGDGAPVIDETRLLQAVIDTQEEERRRIARQVHDGPAQAMANVVLQSEISERMYEIDPQRSRQELAALRQMVNKTLQELRGFIFELRPMILDDLGLVPTLRRYVQTLIDKHGIRLDFSSTGRDRRLGSEDEVAIFRLIQESVVERIEKADANDVVLGMTWKDDSLEIDLQSDGKELPPDGELGSGLRRSERISLLSGESQQEQRGAASLLHIRLPIKVAPQLVS